MQKKLMQQAVEKRRKYERPLVTSASVVAVSVFEPCQIDFGKFRRPTR